jgi:hypothetical protein
MNLQVPVYKLIVLYGAKHLFQFSHVIGNIARCHHSLGERPFSPKSIEFELRKLNKKVASTSMAW